LHRWEKLDMINFTGGGTTVKIRQVGEFGLIDRIKNDTVFDSTMVVTGIGDDAALLRHPDGKLLVATTDMMVEKVHFIISGDNGREIGYRVMAANISDIASMGGSPTHALVSLGVNPEMDVSFVETVFDGMKECCRAFGVNIVGGDTVTSPNNMVLNVALFGWVDPEVFLLRSGAKPGDLVLVTGFLGDSRGALDLISGKCSVGEADAKYLLDRYYYPTPRVKEMAAGIKAGGITSADDISDGLGSEIHEIADASGVGAVIWFNSLPVSPQTLEVSGKTMTDLAEYCLYGGEDFEMVMTAKPEKAGILSQAIESATGTRVSVVGEMVDRSQGVKLLREGRLYDLEKRGYNHF